MPVTKTAKRASRASKRKAEANRLLRVNLEATIRIAKRLSRERSAASRKKTVEALHTAISLTDRAAKKNIIHKNKAARIKSSLSKLLPSQGRAASAKSPKAGGRSQATKRGRKSSKKK